MKKRFISIVLSLSLIGMFCAGCKKDIQCTEHTWQDWQVSKKASCTEFGTEKRVCSVCKEAEYKDIPMLEHNNVNGKCSVCFHSIYRWFDADGTLLYEEATNNQPSKYVLPNDNEKWNYIEWQQKQATNDYYAYRLPQNSYFIGNVFQIVITDLEVPYGFGSAFVFNDEGWFITNAHVMENAYTAQAIFEIPNESTGESFTYLNINEGSYYNLDKDIYIGKIENYNSIKAYYQNIPVSSNYEIGDTTYSVGYPNATALLQINEGMGVMEYATLADKLYNGNTYIYSTSYIAPGSSGGILLNNDLEVIGITTKGLTIEEEFIVGASITTFNFKNLLSYISNSDLVTLEEQFYDDYTTTINLFNQAKADYLNGETGTGRDILEDGTPYYYYHGSSEGVNNNETSYTYEEYVFVCSNGLIQYTTDYYWSTGQRRIINFYGYYSDKYGFSYFTYEFHTEWKNGTYYEIYCDNINYSEDVDLTLKNYTISDKSYGYTVSDSNITYAKEQFNYIIENFSNYMSKYAE